MNLEQLFDMQKELDERILDRFPELSNEDLLDKKILALQVELGELAQNWRGFKFWSEDQEPRTEREIIVADLKGVPVTRIKNPLLEEYVDCLHFILSIGLELKYTNPSIIAWKSNFITKRFNNLFHAVATLEESISCDWNEDEIQENFDNLLSLFIGLGQMLGFEWEQVEQAYFEKNKTNHERQENGY